MRRGRSLRRRVVLLVGLTIGCASAPRVEAAKGDYETCADPRWPSIASGERSPRSPGVRAELRDLLTVCREFVPGHLLLIESSLGTDGEIEAATSEFYRAFVWPSGSAVRDLVTAKLARNDKDRLAALEAAIEKEPSFHFAWRELGELWGRNARQLKQIEAFERAVRSRPNDGLSNLGFARALRAAGRAEEAAPRFQEAIANLAANDPSRPAAEREYVALLLYELRQHGRAGELLDAMLTKSPDEISLWMDRAAADWLAGDRDRAAARYRQVLQRDPREVRAALNIGNLYFQRPERSEEEKRRDWPRARQAYRWFLEHAGEATVDGYDLIDQFLSVPCRLGVIDAALGALPRSAEPARLSDF